MVLEELRYRKTWLACGYLMLAAVTYLSLTSSPVHLDVRYSDKVGHFLTYYTLMGWFFGFYRANADRAAWALGLITMGIGLEVLQGLNPMRTFDYWDMAANSAGVILALTPLRPPFMTMLHHVEARLLRS